MKVGYIILAHILPEHLVRLVQRLRSDEARFFLHVDRRAPRAVMDVVERELGAAPDVMMLPRHRCQWGAFGQVEATLEGVRAVLEAREKLDYAVLLTGQDYPLKPPSAIESTLEQADGRSFMSLWPARGRFLDRVRRWHWFGTVLGRRVRIPHRLLPLAVRRPLPGGLAPFTGTPHWCLARGCLDFIGDVMTHRPELVRSFRWTAHPDEAFFQTILMSSPLARTIVDDDLRYIDHPYGHASPRVLASSDLGALLESEALFARKFDPRVDSRVLDALDAHIDAQTASRTRHRCAATRPLYTDLH